ncbi:MAG: hypothetical protein KAT05_09100 [Spirochaetes bacterium]|nr:hypothetical protein [Spirochaetota bacterium]
MEWEIKNRVFGYVDIDGLYNHIEKAGDVIVKFFYSEWKSTKIPNNPNFKKFDKIIQSILNEAIDKRANKTAPNHTHGLCN